MKFLLFTTDLILARKAENAGVDSIIVDLENKGKEERQKGFDLETNNDKFEDILKLSLSLKIAITVRVNAIENNNIHEIERALDMGAKIIMLPMARTINDVEKFLRIVNRRAQTIIQIETPELAQESKDLRKLEWDFAYIGLNDLMVAKGGHSIWEAIIDGTAESICMNLEGKQYGFGGVTILGGGYPIVNTLILHEVIRLGGSISIMRRTLKNELLDRNFKDEIRLLRNFIRNSKNRGKLAIEHDRNHLFHLIRKLLNVNRNQI